MNDRQKAIAGLCDGDRTSAEIAEILGERQKYVQKTMRGFDLPRRNRGAQPGEMNRSWIGGRIVDLDGYVTVPTPSWLAGRSNGRIAEHRMVMSEVLGRQIEDQEVVDHIDGLHLHNAPSNLRLFASNAEHLKATITSQVPRWSHAGVSRMNSTRRQRKESLPVDTYRRRRECGDVRLQQILLAAFRLGTDSPFLSGTLHHLEKAGIDPSCRTSLERALVDLDRKYA